MSRVSFAIVALVVSWPALARAQRPVGVDDLARVRDVSDPQLSPDGGWVAYTVSVPDTAKDKDDTDLWMASWDGTARARCGSRGVRRTSTRRAGARTGGTSPFSRAATTRGRWISSGCSTVRAASPSG